jgi:hypothetical protein
MQEDQSHTKAPVAIWGERKATGAIVLLLEYPGG